MYRRRRDSGSSDENESVSVSAHHAALDRDDREERRRDEIVAGQRRHRRRVDRSGNDVTDDDDESIFATRLQMSRSELMISTEEYTDARSRDRMRFQDQRARLFGLVRTFDPENRRTVCDLIRSLTVDYFTSLYDMSYRSYRFFDTACRQACLLAPVTLAVSAVAAVATRKSAVVAETVSKTRNGCCEQQPPLPITTSDWLTRRSIENFCRVHFYRAYEYLRCYELQRVILLEAFDRENYAEYVTELFLRENESLAKQREATVARWTTAAATAVAATHCRRNVSDDSGDALLERIAIVAKVIQCSRRTTVSNTPQMTDDATTPATAITSLDLVIAASIQRTAVETATNGRRRGSPPQLLAKLASVWPSWNLLMSRYATSLAKARSVGNVDESIDIVRAAGTAVADDVAEWSCLSAESYDYMELYRRNAQHDRLIIRGDVDFYTNIFCTLFDVIVVSSPVTDQAEQ